MLIWGINIPEEVLDSTSREYLRSLPSSRPAVEWVWQEMDRVWNDIGLSNTLPRSSGQLAKFYGNPVWAMNGLFTMVDPISATHRKSIAAYLASSGCSVVADYGGGFGMLAREIVQQNADASVSIVEPFPSPLAKHLLIESRGIDFISELSKFVHYDAVVAQDVLEHVEDPVGLAFDLGNFVRFGGLIIFANCFYPVIQCHLPHTFHLRHTFRYVMQALGMQFLGRIPGADHALVFRKVGKININTGRRVEQLSQIIGPILNAAHPIFARLKRLLLHK